MGCCTSKDKDKGKSDFTDLQEEADRKQRADKDSQQVFLFHFCFQVWFSVQRDVSLRYCNPIVQSRPS